MKVIATLASIAAWMMRAGTPKSRVAADSRTARTRPPEATSRVDWANTNRRMRRRAGYSRNAGTGARWMGRSVITDLYVPPRPIAPSRKAAQR